MPFKHPTVRVIWIAPDHDKSGMLIEQFRSMGYVRVLSDEPCDDNNYKMVLEFAPPKGVDAEVWCKQTAERLETFNINAVVAPKWGES